MRSCCRCHQERDDSAFQHHKGKPIGWCRVCRTDNMRERRRAAGIPARKQSTVVGGKKLCVDCNRMLKVELFPGNKRGRGGYAAYCNPCSAMRRKILYRESTRRATAVYRERHRERAMAAHRLHQFKRRAGVAATSDGTVTDDVLRRVYAEKTCAYCEQITHIDDRTIDHRVPLARRGKHSASNLVMACRTCNSSKRHMPEAKFRKQLEKMK